LKFKIQNMKNIFSSLSILAFLLITGCAGESKKAEAIDNEKISQRYTASTTEGSDATGVQAEFRIGAYWDRMEEEKTGGEAVEFTAADAITFNGENMLKDNSVFTGAYYSLNKKGPYNPTHTWVWTDAKGKKYTNTITLNPIHAKSVKFFGRDSLRIEWEGGPIEAGEKVIVRFDGVDQNDPKRKKKTANETVTTKGATGVTIGYELVRSFEGSTLDFELQRTTLIRTQEHTPEEGSMKVSYTSKNKSLSSGTSIFNW
jgi:hypothetical protein